MSAFMPEGREQQTGQGAKTPEQGPETYLSPEERRFWQRYTSFPEELSPRFRSWLIDFIAVNIPQIPISQIVGFTQFTAKSASITTLETTTSVSYVDLATVGPELSGLGKGKYLVFLGGQLHNASGGTSVMSVSVNGASAEDANSATVAGSDTTATRALLLDLPNESNTLRAKYRTTSGTSQFQYRFLSALKYGN